MSKTIPYVGEFLHSQDFPAPLRVAHLTAGPATTNDVVITTANTYPLFTVPAGLIVHNVQSIVTSVFTESVTLTIGDSDSAAGYLAAADIGSTDVVTTGILKNSSAAGEAYATGKQYTAAQTIDVVVAGATAAIGVIHVYLVYSMAYND